jgi:hypothetical protein
MSSTTPYNLALAALFADSLETVAPAFKLVVNVVAALP